MDTVWSKLDRKSTAIAEFTMRQYRQRISTWVILASATFTIMLMLLFYVDAMNSEFESIDNDGDSFDDDGDGYPNDILSKIGEPYLKSSNKNSGLGLGLFIGKTLLEKNFATVNCWNSQTRSGAEVTIKWKNKDLFNL